jgi:TrmH family RNA methyltransferase
LISKGQIKRIRALRLKKHRDRERLFVAEGPKLVDDLIEAGLQLEAIYVTESQKEQRSEAAVIAEADMKKISSLRTAPAVLAVFNMPVSITPPETDLILAVDGIQDPGNLGTLIRLADWFGIGHLVCSENTVDRFNPKVVQASMGSIARVNVFYTELDDFLSRSELPVYGGYMDGESVYESALPDKAIVVIGNEGNGISKEVSAVIDHRLGIPPFSSLARPESLNAAVAGAILISEFRRPTGR